MEEGYTMQKSHGTPVVTRMQVIPVAGRDSMLMSLSGAHAPFFTRNVVVLTDSSGSTGVGEIHGGDYTKAVLESYIPLVEGREIGAYRNVVRSLVGRDAEKGAPDDGSGIQSLEIGKLKYVVHAEAAVETAMLDLLGKYMGLPVCALLGQGQQRDRVRMLGYLFFVSDAKRTPLPYRDEARSEDAWFRRRNLPALTPEAIVELARTLQQKYGFRDFKLKGGVLPAHAELEAVKALKKEFPSGRVNIDPNGAWTLREAVDACLDAKWALSYAEDPCGPEAGFSGREINAEFRAATGIPVATNMFAVNWRQFYHAATQKSVDIVLADPHFWTPDGSVRMAQLLADWGLTWGSHSNSHFDITLATFVQCAAAAPGNITAIDTHWVWQDGQYLTKNPPVIADGSIAVPAAPGLGVEVDLDAVMRANELYNKMESHDRDDAAAMQHLIPGWKFDSKKPSLVR